MISKSRLKELAAYRQQRRCDDEAVFIVEGTKMAEEALRSGFDVVAICATDSWWGGRERGIVGEHYEVTDAELERLSLMRSPNEVWMLVRRPEGSQLTTKPRGIVLALDRLQDPGNLGTILRTADWYGVREVICSEGTASLYNPKVVQSTMGAVFRTNVHYVSDLPRWLRESGLPVYAASLQGEPLQKVTTVGGEAAVLLIGNESRGISQEALGCATHTCCIPNLGGTAESLNAAVATGILLNHFCNLKQWNN